MLRHLLALSATLLAAPSFAQESRASAAAKLKAEFAQSDTNKNGSLDRAEVAARLGGMRTTRSQLTPAQKKGLAELWFTRADANRDGRVTQAEAQGLMGQVFRRYDANGDGRIGSGERAAAKAGAKAEVRPGAGR